MDRIVSARFNGGFGRAGRVSDAGGMTAWVGGKPCMPAHPVNARPWAKHYVGAEVGGVPTVWMPGPGREAMCGPRRQLACLPARKDRDPARCLPACLPECHMHGHG
jgi:hypothetical protein